MGEDSEQIEILLLEVPANTSRIVSNEGLGLRRSLGRLRNVGVRVLNLIDNQELVRSENLPPVLDRETALSLGEVYRHNGGWKFKVIGEGSGDRTLLSQKAPAVTLNRLQSGIRSPHLRGGFFRRGR
jgi:tellurium resistance protein TerD